MTKALLISQLTQTARVLRAEAAKVLAAHNVYPGQEPLLLELLREDGQLMGTLAQLLQIRPPTLTKMVSRMSAQGLVRRQRSFQDSREVRLYLSDHGRAIARTLEATLASLEQQATLGLSQDDMNALGSGLSSIDDNLKKRVR